MLASGALMRECCCGGGAVGDCPENCDACSPPPSVVLSGLLDGWVTCAPLNGTYDYVFSPWPCGWIYVMPGPANYFLDLGCSVIDGSRHWTVMVESGVRNLLFARKSNAACPPLGDYPLRSCGACDCSGNPTCTVG